MKKVELISQLEHIFYKIKDDYFEIFFCGNDKYYKIKFLTMIDGYVENEIDNIRINNFNKVIKEFSHNESAIYIYFSNETESEILFMLDNKLKEYCKEITKTEFFKELI